MRCEQKKRLSESGPSEGDFVTWSKKAPTKQFSVDAIDGHTAWLSDEDGEEYEADINDLEVVEEEIVEQDPFRPWRSDVRKHLGDIISIREDLYDIFDKLSGPLTQQVDRSFAASIERKGQSVVDQLEAITDEVKSKTGAYIGEVAEEEIVFEDEE